MIPATDLGDPAPPSPVEALVADAHALLARAWASRVIEPSALALWAAWSGGVPLAPAGSARAVLAHSTAVYWRDRWAGKANGAPPLLARALEEVSLSFADGAPRPRAAGLVADAGRALDAVVARRAKA